MIVLYLLLAVGALVFYLIKQQKEKFNYWRNCGVPQLENQHLLFGDFQEYGKINPIKLTDKRYKYFKKLGVKLGGLYQFNRPILMIVDPSLVKLIVTKDFHYFTAHNPKIGNGLLFNNLFHMSGDEWKDARRKLTPTFTSGKIKMMSDIVIEKANELVNLIEKMNQNGQTAEIKEVLARYTTDVIGSCAFGIECNSIQDENSVFFQRGQDLFRKLNNMKPPTLLKLISLFLGKKRSISFDVSDIEDFFRNLVNDTIELREQNKTMRKDFLQLMIQLKNRGSIADIMYEKDVYQKAEGIEILSMEDIAGQCMLFFTAGFETSSTTMSFALLELAQNPEVQNKLREEVREVLQKYNGILCYEAIQELTYCDNVIKETLRKYPPLIQLPRMCTKKYKVPDTDMVIDEGATVSIPIQSIQNDPEYFPNPEKFDPERFNEENKSKIVDYTYLPFGEGPRQCLGLRFALIQSKAGLASLINRFHFTRNQKTPYPPKFALLSAILTLDGGIWLDVKNAN